MCDDEPDWQVVFFRPIGAKPTQCEVVVLSEVFNAPQGEAYNHLLFNMVSGAVIMIVAPEQVAMEYAERANKFLDAHREHGALTQKYCFEVIPTVRLH